MNKFDYYEYLFCNVLVQRGAVKGFVQGKGDVCALEDDIPTVNFGEYYNTANY